MKWTKEKTWATHSPTDSSFIWPANEFLHNPHRGMEYLKQAIVPLLGGGSVMTSSESVYQMIPALEGFQGSRILVVGAGPTAKDIRLNFSEYDKIVTCNHYFLNKQICELDISMVFLGDEVRNPNPELKKELSRTNYLIGFENVGRDPQELRLFKEEYGERVFWAHTRYHSKIGAIPRIVSFLCTLYPKSVDIIGMDGYIPNNLRDVHGHAFEEGKGNSGTLEASQDEDGIMSRYEAQYLEFWDYVLHDLAPTVEFRNLGHNHPANISTKVLTSQLGEDYPKYLLGAR